MIDFEVRHYCQKQVEYQKLMEEFPELDDSLMVYPSDAIIYYYHGQWWMKANEFSIPITYCAYCGQELE